MTLRQRLHTAGALILLAAAGLAVAATAASSTPATRAAAAATTFSDPAGDSNGAPDITTVTIDGNAESGAITFSVTATGVFPASADGRTRAIEAALDTDKNPSTGSKTGADYMLHTDNGPNGTWWGVSKWTGSSWQLITRTATVNFYPNGDTYTWMVNKTDIGGTTGFEFYVGAYLVDASDNVVAEDYAPDGDVWWTWDMPSASTSTTTTVATTTTTTTTTPTATPGPAQTMTTLYSPVIAKPVAVPARALAGKRLTVSFRVTRSDDGKSLMSGKMICDPSVAGKVVRHAESFKSGVARLSFVVPKAAKGKQLKVKLTIKAPSYKGEDGSYIDIATGETGTVHNLYSGQSATKIVSFPVR